MLVGCTVAGPPSGDAQCVSAAPDVGEPGIEHMAGGSEVSGPASGEPASDLLSDEQAPSKQTNVTIESNAPVDVTSGRRRPPRVGETKDCETMRCSPRAPAGRKALAAPGRRNFTQ
jgi:hypothetical protein